MSRGDMLQKIARSTNNYKVSDVDTVFDNYVNFFTKLSIYLSPATLAMLYDMSEERSLSIERLIKIALYNEMTDGDFQLDIKIPDETEIDDIYLHQADANKLLDFLFRCTYQKMRVDSLILYSQDILGVVSKERMIGAIAYGLNKEMFEYVTRVIGEEKSKDHPHYKTIRVSRKYRKEFADDS